MTRRQRLESNNAAVRGQSSGARAHVGRSKTLSPDSQTRGRKYLDPATSAKRSKKKSFSLQNLDYYRPLKKPVTLRLDADVLAWFKKDGSRYQTRINSALRKIMEREMKQR